MSKCGSCKCGNGCTKAENLKCEDCGIVASDVNETKDPYRSELGQTFMITVCDDCFLKRAFPFIKKL